MRRREVSMFGKGIHLFKLLGFEVRVDASWLILAVLISWSLATGFFPSRVPHLGAQAYWWMGIAATIGLFLSIVFHELCHSLVARHYGLPMKGITLFIFGGVAEMEEEPASAKIEFLMAFAGPVASLVLGGAFYLAHSASGGLAPASRSVLYYLSFINVLLAAFNLLPAFPLDGGRIFRSALWKWKGNIRWATRIASQTGSAFGVLLIVLGAVTVLRGDFIGGMWWFLIGMFLRNAARSSYQQLIVRRALEGQPVGRFMTRDPIVAPPWISLRDLVDNYIYRYHFKMFPVANDGELIGCVQLSQVKTIPPDDWDRHTVRELADRCSANNSVTPQTDAMRALALMSRTGNRRLLVVDQGRLVGVVALKDLLEFLSLKIDLEE